MTDRIDPTVLWDPTGVWDGTVETTEDGHCDHCDPECRGADGWEHIAGLIERSSGRMPTASWLAGHCPVCKLITQTREKHEVIRAMMEATPPVTPEWLLADARKPRRYLLCPECHQPVLQPEAEQ